MPRLSESDLTRIKAISLLDILAREGVELKAQGKDFVTCCVFHDDATASLTISPDKNLYHCFGCGVAGSPVDWVMTRRKLSFRAACDALQVEFGFGSGVDVGNVDVIRPDATSTTIFKSPTSSKLPPTAAFPLTADAAPQALLSAVLDYYQQTLHSSSEALDYLRQRGLLSGVRGDQLIAHFRLGYANRTLGYRLPSSVRKAGIDIRLALQAVGILRESGHEHLNGSVVVPVIDASGAITDLYGRKILNNLRHGTPLHLYLKGAHQGVWNAQGLLDSIAAGQREIILCESLFDAMSYWVHGFDNVTCSYGARGFGAQHVALFKQLAGGAGVNGVGADGADVNVDAVDHSDHGLQRVLIAYDADKAGDDAAAELVQTLLAVGIGASRIEYVRGQDANDYAQLPDAAARLAEVVRHARWLTGKQNSHSSHSHQRSQHNEQINNKIIAVAASPVVATAASATATTTTSSVPTAPTSTLPILTGDMSELFLTLPTHRYRVRGLERNPSDDVLKVQLTLFLRASACSQFAADETLIDEMLHLDKLDLYSSKQRQMFVNQAVIELGALQTSTQNGRPHRLQNLGLSGEVFKKDMGQLLLLLENKRAEGMNATTAHLDSALQLSELEQSTALALLNSADLAARILADFALAGVVGEDSNKLVGYLACVSRKLDRPLAVLIQSSSAAGKSALMDAILGFMPEDERVQYSAMTGQSLYYMGESNLKHKILAISEEEGAHHASYALKLLQSEGKIKIASTGKDEASGKLVTQEYQVEGPVMLMMTTTAIDIDEELLNRCLVLSVNEGMAQTCAIHEAQRHKRTLAGLQAKVVSTQIRQVHQHAQQLLERLAVINPYADQLKFSHAKTRSRRDHEKYLTLIDSIALLHQHQRCIHSLEIAGQSIRYVEVDKADIALANRLAKEVLGRTLDELPPQTRKLLHLIETAVRQAIQGVDGQPAIKQSHYLFSRKQIRAWCGWSDTQVKVHVDRLTDMEYLLSHTGSRGKSYVYELLYSGEGNADGQFVMGLLEVAQLQDVNTTAPTATEIAIKTETVTVTTTNSTRVTLPQITVSTRGENGGFTTDKTVVNSNDSNT